MSTHHHQPDAAGHTVAHHFDSAAQAYEASKLGVWLFLVTEILLFGGLFVAYIMYRIMYPEAFHEASHHLNRIMGAVNTIVLICSSFTMAKAVQTTKHGQLKAAANYLFITVMCGLAFMVVKYFEYSAKFAHGLLPGAHFTNEEIKAPAAKMFFSLYFMMTGLHGIHVLVGMALITWCLVKARRGHVGPSYYTPVEMTGLYWHLVDLIWIYLFPLLYLVG